MFSVALCINPTQQLKSLCLFAMLMYNLCQWIRRVISWNIQCKIPLSFFIIFLISRFHIDLEWNHQIIKRALSAWPNKAINTLLLYLCSFTLSALIRLLKVRFVWYFVISSRAICEVEWQIFFGTTYAGSAYLSFLNNQSYL